jgi:tRNA1Val (adenine37-N6)-methyltransferase
MDARSYFPRGLAQPEGGFRFSVDALVLACFATRKSRTRVVDLGAGCGVVGFGYALRGDVVSLAGVECDAVMAACARRNAELLDMAYALHECDLREVRAQLPPESADLALLNPPYHKPGCGRLPADASLSAKFAEEGGLADFLGAAAYLVANRGRAAIVFGADRLDALLAECQEFGLAPKRLRMVHGHVDAPARLVLVEAVKNGRPGLAVEPPLILHTTDGNDGNTPTPEALAFCPFLSCNPGTPS